jgi:hypothetical protein
MHEAGRARAPYGPRQRRVVVGSAADAMRRNITETLFQSQLAGEAPPLPVTLQNCVGLTISAGDPECG